MTTNAWTIERIAAAVAPVAEAAGVERVILFGSAARGRATRRSDLDFVAIQSSEARFLDRIGALLGRFVEALPGAAVDLLVYTPAEFDRMVRNGNRFLRRVLAEGKVVYERGR